MSILPFEKVKSLLFSGNTSKEVSQPLPSNIPCKLKRLARVLKSIELVLKKNHIPLTLSTPANVYFECIQEFLSSLASYSGNTFSNPEVVALIKNAFTSQKTYNSSTYSPFLYFLALRVAKGNSELFIYEKLRYDNWVITVKPLQETFLAAVDLIVRLDAVRSLILADDEPLLLQHLPEFHRSWEVFATQLVKERTENYCCFCPSICIRIYLDNLNQYSRLEERLRKIKNYMDTFPEDFALIERCIEKVPLEHRDETTMRCFLAAQKTLELSTNHLDCFAGNFFREVKICNTQPPVL